MKELAIMWLLVLIIMIVIEIATMGLTTIWFAGGAVVAFLLTLFQVPFKIQLVVFLIVSFVLLFATRPLAMKYLNRKRTKTNIDELIGKHAVVLQEINNLKGEGQILLNGIEWTARSAEDKVIPKDREVKVVEIEGVKAFVTDATTKKEETE